MSGASTHLEHDWFDAPLPHNVRIGERSWLYSSFAFIHYASMQPDAVTIGNDSGIYNGTFFDLGTQGAVSIGEFCAVVGAIFATNSTVTLSDYVYVAHEVVFADSPWAVPAPLDSGPVTSVENDVWIGARAVILGGSTLGQGSIIGAGAVVQGDVPAFSIVAGNPARVVGRAR